MGEGGHPLFKELLYTRSFSYVVSYYAHGLPAAAQDDAAAGLDIEERAVLAPVLPLPDEAATLPYGLLDVLIYAIPIVGDYVVERHALQLVGGVAQRLSERGVRSHDAPGLDVHQADVLGDLFDHRAVEPLALPQGLLVLLALGNVTGDGDHPVVHHRGDRGVEPHPLAIYEQAVLVLDSLLCLERAAGVRGELGGLLSGRDLAQRLALER